MMAMLRSDMGFLKSVSGERGRRACRGEKP
jgi:hypothetical protein